MTNTSSTSTMPMPWRGRREAGRPSRRTALTGTATAIGQRVSDFADQGIAEASLIRTVKLRVK
jgi:hypothetical protein